MYAIEFQTVIKDGIIEIPEEYKERLREQGGEAAVRVIVLSAESERPVDLIDQLFSNPLNVSDFVPLRRNELYDRT